MKPFFSRAALAGGVLSLVGCGASRTNSYSLSSLPSSSACSTVIPGSFTLELDGAAPRLVGSADALVSILRENDSSLGLRDLPSFTSADEKADIHYAVGDRGMPPELYSGTVKAINGAQIAYLGSYEGDVTRHLIDDALKAQGRSYDVPVDAGILDSALLTLRGFNTLPLGDLPSSVLFTPLSYGSPGTVLGVKTSEGHYRALRIIGYESLSHPPAFDISPEEDCDPIQSNNNYHPRWFLRAHIEAVTK